MKSPGRESSYEVLRTPDSSWFGQHGMEKSERPFDAPEVLRPGDLNPIDDRSQTAKGMRQTFRDPKYQPNAPANAAAGIETLDDAMFWMNDLWRMHPTVRKPSGGKRNR